MRLFGFSPTRATRPTWALAELDIDYEALSRFTSIEKFRTGWSCRKVC